MPFSHKLCEDVIGYCFKDKNLLKLCFTHPSLANERGIDSYDRLEFFGDTILGEVVAEHLFKTTNGDAENLNNQKSNLVREETLRKVVKNLGLDKFILLGNGLKKTVRGDEKLFSDVYEAIIAGIYLDGGFEKAKEFVFRTLINPLSLKGEQFRIKSVGGEAITLFQEYVQKNHLGKIEYIDLKKTGADHNPEFLVELRLDGKPIAKGVGSSKQKAKANSANIALEIIKNQQKQ